MTTKQEAFGNSAEAKSAKIIARNTFKRVDEAGNTIIRLHKTDIIIKAPDGTITLNSGGWHTPTTKARMQPYARVRQDRGLWYIGKQPFFDGIKIDAAGNVLNAPKRDIEAAALKDKARIKKFCAKVTKDNLPTPDAGDCWLCSMRDKNGRTMGAMRGAASDAEHIKSHVTEGYLHGSLLVNAMRAAGYHDEGIRVHYSMKTADVFRRALRRYLQKIYGLAA
jgi:hypothetical protein